MRLLLERQDVEPDSQDNTGQTPLSWANKSWYGREALHDVVRLLREAVAMRAKVIADHNT